MLRLHNTFRNSPILYDVYNNDDSYKNEKFEKEILHLGFQLRSVPEHHLVEYLDAKVAKWFSQFKEKYNFIVVDFTKDHVSRTLHKYFNRQKPFDIFSTASQETEIEESNTTANTKQKKDASTERRKNIPDALIIEAAIDLKDQGHNIVVLGADKKFCETLEHHKIEFVKTLEDALARVSIPSSSVHYSGIDSEPSASAKLTDHNELHQKVLAVVHLLSANNPVQKESLIKFLEKFGYATNKIIATADYLTVVLEVLRKIGDGYIPRDKKLCKEAFDAILPEFARVMSEGQLHG